MAARRRRAEDGGPSLRRRVSDWLARGLRRLAEAAGRASARLAAPPPETRPDGPPEHWLAVVRERAPQLLDRLAPPVRGQRAPEPADLESGPEPRDLESGPEPPDLESEPWRPRAVPGRPATPRREPIGRRRSTPTAPGTTTAAAASTSAPPEPGAGVPRRLVTSLSQAAQELLELLVRQFGARPVGGRARAELRPAGSTDRGGRGRSAQPTRSRAVPDRRRQAPPAQAPEAVPPRRSAPRPTQGASGPETGGTWSALRQAQGTLGPEQADPRSAPRQAQESPRAEHADRGPEAAPPSRGRWPELPETDRLLGDDLVWQPARPEFSAARIARLDDEQRGG